MQLVQNGDFDVEIADDEEKKVLATKFGISRQTLYRIIKG